MRSPSACGASSVGARRRRAARARAPDPGIGAALAPASPLLYSAPMPAQVVVVRRSRRSLFAAPRALPDLLRSLRAALLPRVPPARVDATGGTAAPTSGRTAPPQGGVARAGPAPAFDPAVPRLIRKDEGGHRCIGCLRCVDVCPSRCLAVDAEEAMAGESAPRRIARFVLETGACIGCRDCVSICPERALEMHGATPLARSVKGAGDVPFDLLAAVR